jgi:mercuric reductase
MVETRYDLIILGGGAAAFAAALKAAEIDAKVAMIERGTIGGTCVNVGCIPSKNLLGIGELIHDCLNKKLDEQSFQSMKFDFRKIIQDKDDLVLKLRNQKYADVLKSMPNTEFIQGNAKFRSRNEIEVNGKILKAKNILIATGSSAAVPQINGIDKVDYLTNVESLSLEEKPDSMIIIGGRTLGLEFAQMYSRFGTKITLLQRSDRIMPEEEPEISDAMKSYLEEEGMEIHTGVKIQSVRNDGEEKVVSTSESEFRAEKLLMATGRKPNTADLALENAGVLTSESGAVVVDDEMRTNVSNIFAAGDVIGEPMLETVAAKEGSIAASNALFGTHKKIDLSVVPHAIFTSPQVASVGMTEKESTEKYGSCSCKTLLMADVPKAAVVNKTKGLIKMVVEPQTHRIIGVHILSDLAADIIHEAVLAVKYNLTIDDIIDTVHVFPTMSESIKLVATSFKKNVKQLSCCVE